MPRIRILPTIKAYPVIDRTSFSEAVCVAGIDMGKPRRWIRLFPLDFRALGHPQRFKKYEVIDLDVVESRADPRPESYAPRLDSIERGEHIGTDNGTWARRMQVLDDVEDDSMCGIQRRQKTARQSLGLFRPLEIVDLKASPAPPDFEASQRAVIEQASLLGDRAGDPSRRALEPLPLKAKFKYRCADARCRGHEQSFIDWEIGAFYRRPRDREGRDQRACLAAVREHFLGFCDAQHDVRFLTGSMLSHPSSFLILGLAYPKRKKPMQETTLF